MLLKDFIFNYTSCLLVLFKNKELITFIKRLFLLPYKFIISNLSDFFFNKDIDKINSLNNSNSLDEYFKYFDCDKSSLVHGYDKFYSNELKKFKDLDISIIEFGIHYGASQAAFSKYFVNSKIIGVDKNPYYKKFYSKNIRSLFCDVSDNHSLMLLKNYIKHKVDIIIDDASHIPDHQLKTFIEMFDLLKNKGIYIIEELDIYESFSEAYNKNSNNNQLILRNFLYQIKNEKDLSDVKFTKNFELLEILKKIEWVKIFRGDYMINNRNVSEIAFIKKR